MRASQNWLSSRERAQQCRKWRKARMAEAARRHHKWLCQMLLLGLCLESVCLVRQYYQEKHLRFYVFHVDEDYHAEWVKEAAPGSGQRFGVRLNPERLEIEFYHQTQEVKKIPVFNLH
ncbi:MAG: hypothetical protein ACI39W_06620 [Brotaphodocola sp.]